MDHLIGTMRKKGARIVHFPSAYDANTIVPFFLMNDHSILVFKNPKKDVINYLKLIIRKGFIFFKKQNHPIKLNATVWVLIDSITFQEKQTKKEKTIPQLMIKEYGTDFA